MELNYSLLGNRELNVLMTLFIACVIACFR